MIVEGNTISADIGKVIRRKGTNDIYGSQICLGYSYYIDGILQSPPHKDVIEDFEEIPIPDPIDDVETDDLEHLSADKNQDYQTNYVSMVRSLIREKYTISDELAFIRQKDTKPEEFQEYFDFCESCKNRAREELGIEKLF